MLKFEMVQPRKAPHGESDPAAYVDTRLVGYDELFYLSQRGRVLDLYIMYMYISF